MYARSRRITISSLQVDCKFIQVASQVLTSICFNDATISELFSKAKIKENVKEETAFFYFFVSKTDIAYRIIEVNKGRVVVTRLHG